MKTIKAARQKQFRSLDFDFQCALLHDYHRRTYVDIAETVGCSEYTIKAAVLRYRKDFQDLRRVRHPDQIVDYRYKQQGAAAI